MSDSLELELEAFESHLKCLLRIELMSFWKINTHSEPLNHLSSPINGILDPVNQIMAWGTPDRYQKIL